MMNIFIYYINVHLNLYNTIYTIYPMNNIHIIYTLQDFHLAKRYYDQAATYDIGIHTIYCYIQLYTILYYTIRYYITLYILYSCIPYTLYIPYSYSIHIICYVFKDLLLIHIPYFILYIYLINYTIYYTYTLLYTKYIIYI